MHSLFPAGEKIVWRSSGVLQYHYTHDGDILYLVDTSDSC